MPHHGTLLLSLIYNCKDCCARNDPANELVFFWAMNQVSKRPSHCEDPPIGGDEAISLSKLDID
jgi:hypothetical protein